ncbi:MAG: hypothetical protein RMX96_26965 [Nostoc sp. ChiSLP02]|nr:hypothetical protein [Nostoc sp. DedSLP05]MDZ8101032.1 hypothetical protein [Nostoc sp. DedSLP01]MDZ8188486.1 hypothetical protein [Nostoc sp. ChiSLP02]
MNKFKIKYSSGFHVKLTPMTSVRLYLPNLPQKRSQGGDRTVYANQ